MESQPAKRAYNSSRRKEQARQTRRQIIEAAKSLFFENGYSGTTIEAIAAAAGVAVETVYAVFGSKRAILNEFVNTSIVGDDQPISLLQREHIQVAASESDPQRLVRKFSKDIYAIMQRMSPIFALLRSTAKSEPEIAELLDRLLKDRLQGMSYFVSQLRRLGALNPEMEQHAVETVWALSSAEVFHLLTVDRGWTEETYTRWLETVLSRALLT